MKVGVFLKNGGVIGLILLMIFLSQQPYFKDVSKNFTFPFLKKGNGYFSNAPLDWLRANVYPRVALEAEKRGEEVQEEITHQTEEVKQSALDSFRNYTAEKLLNVLGVKPEDLVPACQVLN